MTSSVPREERLSRSWRSSSARFSARWLSTSPDPFTLTPHRPIPADQARIVWACEFHRPTNSCMIAEEVGGALGGGRREQEVGSNHDFPAVELEGQRVGTVAASPHEV